MKWLDFFRESNGKKVIGPVKKDKIDVAIIGHGGTGVAAITDHRFGAPSSNPQPTRELQYFQRILTQNKYIAFLKGAVDQLEWEIEKRDAIIDDLRDEVVEYMKGVEKDEKRFANLEWEFKQHVQKSKGLRQELERAKKDQAKLHEVTRELEETKKRLKVQHRLNELLTKQNNHG